MTGRSLCIFGTLALICLFLPVACSESPADSSGSGNSSRAITSFTLGAGQIGEAAISSDADSSTVIVHVEEGTDLSAVTPAIEISAGASIEPASGESVDFAANDHRYTYTVTSESGVTQKWYVKIIVEEDEVRVYKDDEVTDFFRRESGWTAGDGANSIPLSDDRVLWLMDDSHINDYANGTVSCYFQVNNAVMLQPLGNWDRTQTTTLTGPNTTSFVKSNPAEDYFNWIVTGLQLGDTVYVFSSNLKYGPDHEVQTAGPPVWAKIKHPELTVAGYQQLQDFGGITFGSGFVKESDGYVYAYGFKPVFVVADVYVARFPQSNPNAAWSFWTGSDWSGDVTQATAIGESASNVPFVSKVRDTYVMFSTELSVGCNQGTGIYVSTSDSPTGPFSRRKLIYEIDDRFGGNVPRFYWAKAHPEYINEEDELLVTYDLNGLSGCEPFCSSGRLNPDKYRPKGIRVPLELIDPAL